jgi:hypothetical protein
MHLLNHHTDQNDFWYQGCQMVCFQTKNTNLGKFWRDLDWKRFINFMAIWNILWTLGIFYDYLVHFVFIWYIWSCTNKNLATLLGAVLSQKKFCKKKPETVVA